MAVNETITGNTASAEFTPSQMASVAIIHKVGSDAQPVIFEAKAPGGDWVFVTELTGVYSFSTPDTAVVYRVRPQNVVNGIKVYLGP